MTGSASSGNNMNILASLPPIVPSIGFSRGKRPGGSVVNAAAASDGNPNDDPSTTTTTTTTTAAAAAPAVDHSADDASNNNNNNNNNNINAPSVVKVGNRLILTSKPARSWAWKSFASTARRDDVEFHHWVRSNVEYADYPYARFDVCLDPLVYTDEEYEEYFETINVEELLMTMMEGGEEEEEWDMIAGEKRRRRRNGMGGTSVGGGGWEEEKEGAGGGSRTKDSSAVDDIDASKNSNNDRPSSSSTSTSTLQRLLSVHNKVLPWTKSETDALLELARSCDLRWSVIIDRWRTRFANSPSGRLRNVEDLQHRYYEVGSVLIRRRAEMIVAREVKRLSREDREGGEGGISAPVASGDVGGEGAAATVASVGVGRSAPTAQRGETHADSPAAPASSTVTDSKSPAPSATTIAVAAAAAAQQQRSESDPVIPPSEIEAIQQLHRQITVDPTLVPPLSVPDSGTAHHRGGARAFDLAAERARRAQLDRLWHRTKGEEREEEELRAELRMVEAQLRKLKRAGKHVAPAGSASAAPPSGGGGGGGGGAGGGGDGGGSGTPGGMATHADVRRGGSSAPVVAAAGASNSRASSSAAPPPPPPHRPMPHPPLPSHRPPLDLYLHTHQSVSASFVDTAPVPTPGTPYLQSGRLFPPAIEGHSGLNNGTLKQMNAILQELNVPRDPIPTKRNCDLYDGVRKDALTLLILQKILLRKEGELNAKREKLLDIQRAAAAAAAVAAAKEEAEKKKKNDEKAEETKNDGKEEGGKAGKVVARPKAKRQRADSSASNQNNTAVAGGGGGAGTGKKRSDGPKKKYQKKPKIDLKSAATAAIATATVIPAAANAASIPATGEPTGTMPPPAVPSAANPTVAPTVTSTKEPAAAKPPSSLNAQPQPQLGNSVDTDVNDTSAPEIIPAKIPGKRGRKPKKKQEH